MQLSMVSSTPTPPGYSGDFHLYTLGITLKKRITTQIIPYILILPRKKLPYLQKKIVSFYISIWLKYLQILNICDIFLKYPYFTFLERSSVRISRPQQYLSWEICVIVPTLGSNSPRKVVRFAPYFPHISPLNPHTPRGGRYH